jgi:hypothetical protein
MNRDKLDAFLRELSEASKNWPGATTLARMTRPTYDALMAANGGASLVIDYGFVLGLVPTMDPRPDWKVSFEAWNPRGYDYFPDWDNQGNMP